MSEGPKIPLSKATNVATRFLTLIKPHILKAEVAGSVRRQVKEVGDVEIVCVENPFNSLNNLFYKGYPGLVIDGPRLKRFKYPKDNIQIELYITTTWDYGRILAIRTGSSAYSHLKLATTWNRLGWCGTEWGLRRKKECIHKKTIWKLNPEFTDTFTRPPIFNTEADFYNFLGIEWIPPTDRNWSSNVNQLNYSK